MTGSFSFLKIALGPTFACLIWITPLTLTTEQQTLLGIMSWVVTWWITEAIPLPITALFGATLCALVGIAPPKEVFAPFAHPLIFLFFGGFLLAKAMQVHGLDQKIAFFILSRKMFSKNPARILIALFFVCSFLSMWISNTATTAMLLPIALGIFSVLFPKKPFLQSTVLIGLAYASSIGGIGTPVGSPPNMIAIGMLEKFVDIQISFVEWMLFTLPVLVGMFLFLSLFTLKKIKFDLSSMNTSSLSISKDGIGKLNPAQKSVFLVVAFTGSLWVFPGLVKIGMGPEHPFSVWLKDHLSEPVVALIGATLLFLVPNKKRALLSFQEASQIDWGALLLFGGGLSLGGLVFSTGLGSVIGEPLSFLANSESGFWIFLFFSVFGIILATELTSNTATANMMIPIVIAVAEKNQFSPLLVTLGVSMSCSLAFMLPVATPPNAIVYGSGRVQVREMMKFGVWMNLAGGLMILFFLWLYQMIGWI